MESKNKKGVLDLFAGAGGFSWGFSQEGFSLRGALEVNTKYANTHKLNFPLCEIIADDIRNWSPRKFAKEVGIKNSDIQVIIGGPPCQTFSSIGGPKINSILTNGVKSDERNFLYKNYFEYVDYFKPDIFLMENVPTMRTKYKGKVFKEVLQTIDNIGYNVSYDVLNSCHYGVPQLRKRLIVVGVRKTLKKRSFEFPVPTHFIPSEEELIHSELEEYTKVSDAIGDLPEIFDGIRAGQLPYSMEAKSDFQKEMRGDRLTVGNNVCRVSNDRAKRVFPHMNQGSKYMDLPKEVRSILPFREDIFPDRLKRLSNDLPSWTILAHIGMDGYMYIHPSENRTLSVREAARIQSFPDSFEFTGNMREQYIQVGNSVPPRLSLQLAKSVKKFYND